MEKIAYWSLQKKVFFCPVKWKETRKKKKQITSEIITLPTKMKTEKKWTNHDTHTHKQWYQMQPKRESVKRKSFQCVLFFAPSPFCSLTHSYARTFGYGVLLSEWKDARLFQVVMAVAMVNENNNVKKTQPIFVLLPFFVLVKYTTGYVKLIGLKNLIRKYRWHVK